MRVEGNKRRAADRHCGGPGVEIRKVKSRVIEGMAVKTHWLSRLCVDRNYFRQSWQETEVESPRQEKIGSSSSLLRGRNFRDGKEARCGVWGALKCWIDAGGDEHCT